MLSFFRAISILEGCSYLAILCVTLGLVSRDYVFTIGMGHGVLFMLYLIFSLLVCNKARWSLMIWLALFLAAIIPFAFILVELWLQRTSSNQEAIQNIIKETG